MKKFALALGMVLLMCGCGSSPSTVPVIVKISPAAAPNLDQGQTLQLAASLTGDSSGKGVAWTVAGPGCAGATCGSLISQTSSSATYRAPAAVSTAMTVTVTATSVAQPGQNASTSFSVNPPPRVVTNSLPAATPNYVYHSQLSAEGGVQPLNWTVASGTLPAGMSLNESGVLFGVPTTGGSSTFTVRVTDSSTATGGPLTTQQTLTISVVGILTIPATSFPDGKAGTAYSASLPVSGGVAPYSWSVYYGSVPSGLVLQSNGVISGTPTVVGSFTFSVTVVDSSPIQQTYTSSNFTITIDPSGPLTIRTTALMDGSAGTPYQAQLVATGGSAPLGWSVIAGAGLPAGLALNPTTGAISGTPSAATGAYAFTVQVSDASSPVQTATQQLSITITSPVAACSSSGNNTALFGQYAFQLRGFNGAGYLAVVGSLTADGAGNITAGEADTNGVLGAQTGNLIAGASSYSVGADNRGCATIATPFGTFYTRFALGGVASGVGSAGRIIEFENPGSTAYIASGEILLQSPAAFISALSGSYNLRISGWDAAASGRYACVGTVIGASNKFSYLQQDCNDDGTVTNTVNTINNSPSTINTYSAADMNGRGTGNLSVGPTTSSFVFYWVTPARLLIVNSDPEPVFAGDWQQGSSGFGQSSLLGSYGFFANGVASSGAGGDVVFGIQTADGANSISFQAYRDGAGSLQTTTPACNYSVVSIGRVTLNGNNCGANPPIFYLNGSSSRVVSGFELGTDSRVELGRFDPQATGLTNASVAGTYFIGTSEIVSQSASATVGTVTLASNGVLTSTTDTSSATGQSVGTAASDTYTLNPAGTLLTGSTGATIVGLAITGNEFVMVSNPTLMFPALQIGQR